MNHYITEKERGQIEILLKEKYTVKRIAQTLGHNYHTIYNEIKRGTVKQLDTFLQEHYVYKSDYAQMVYETNVANRGRNLKIGNDHALAEYIETMLRVRKYSPEALLAHARNEGLHFKTNVCYKTIYNYLDMGLFLNADNGNLPYKKEGTPKEKKKLHVALHSVKGQSIEDRPRYIDERRDFGHWEMDTVYSAKGQGKACLLVLSERMTRKELIFKIPDRTSTSVVHALDAYERKIGHKRFRDTFRTITCDNGSEFSDFKGIQQSVKGKKRTTLYYCHAYASWERGTNENINRMIRRVYPKGTNFEQVTEKQVQDLQNWINSYPRKIFGGLSTDLYIQSKGLAVA